MDGKSKHLTIQKWRKDQKQQKKNWTKEEKQAWKIANRKN
jgi:hypothetical protein